jgi:hypothetical protein
MRRLVNLKTLVAVAIALGAFGVAAAQTAPGGPPSGAKTDALGPELATRQDVQLSTEQMLAEAKKSMPQMDRGAAVVRQQLEQARAAKDVVKVLCLNDKLNQIDVAVRSASDRMGSLESAVTRNDRDRIRHEYAVLMVLRDRVRSLVSEANQCIGEETGFIGESTVRVEIDPTIPDGPSPYAQQVPDDIFSPPPPVSQTR